MPVLFEGPSFRALEIGEGDLPALQRFFEANPEYFLAVSGEPPGPDAAREEFTDRPPADWPWDGKWMIRFDDGSGEMMAVADVVRNLLAEGVWHIGLFVVASRLHGTGASGRLHDALVAWARRGGARWMRLNVASGNTRAERFWEKCGYVEVRRREGIVIGRRSNTMRVLVKPLAGEGLDDYLRLVPRDVSASP